MDRGLARLDAGAWWVWLLGLLFYDFLYYWHHRLGHTTALLWAAHAVHHRSEDYNLSTALRQTGSGWLVGRAVSHADLSLFQALEGLAYAFPRAFARASRATPGVLALRERVRARPRIAAYLASERRMPFNQEGIFRHYPELDARRAPAARRTRP